MSERVNHRLQPLLLRFTPQRSWISSLGVNTTQYEQRETTLEYFNLFLDAVNIVRRYKFLWLFGLFAVMSSGDFSCVRVGPKCALPHVVVMPTWKYSPMT